MFSPMFVFAGTTTNIMPWWEDSPSTNVAESLTAIRDFFDEDEVDEQRKKICMDAGKVNNRRYHEVLTYGMLSRRVGKSRFCRPRNDGRNDKFGFKRRS